MAPTPGGWKSPLAGVALYTNWLSSHGVDTSVNSTYTDGIALMSLLTLLCAENRCHAMRPGHFMDQAQQSIFAPGAWLSAGARTGGQ